MIKMTQHLKTEFTKEIKTLTRAYAEVRKK